jgi:hypothetical protein
MSAPYTWQRELITIVVNAPVETVGEGVVETDEAAERVAVTVGDDESEPVMLPETVELPELVPVRVLLPDAARVGWGVLLGDAFTAIGTASISAWRSLPRMTITCAVSDNSRVTLSEATFDVGSATTAVTDNTGDPPGCSGGEIFTVARLVSVAT